MEHARFLYPLVILMSIARLCHSAPVAFIFMYSLFLFLHVHFSSSNLTHYAYLVIQFCMTWFYLFVVSSLYLSFLLLGALVVAHWACGFPSLSKNLNQIKSKSCGHNRHKHYSCMPNIFIWLQQ